MLLIDGIELNSLLTYLLAPHSLIWTKWASKWQKGKGKKNIFLYGDAAVRPINAKFTAFVYDPHLYKILKF